MSIFTGAVYRLPRRAALYATRHFALPAPTPSRPIARGTSRDPEVGSSGCQPRKRTSSECDYLPPHGLTQPGPCTQHGTCIPRRWIRESTKASASRGQGHIGCPTCRCPQLLPKGIHDSPINMGDGLYPPARRPAFPTTTGMFKTHPVVYSKRFYFVGNRRWSSDTPLCVTGIGRSVSSNHGQLKIGWT